MKILIFEDDLNTEEIQVFIGNCLISREIKLQPVVVDDLRKVVKEIEADGR